MKVTNEEMLAEVVRNWVEFELPGDPEVAERAVALALRCRDEGATVMAACQEARSFVRSWAAHPSHWCPVLTVVPEPPPVALAS